MKSYSSADIRCPFYVRHDTQALRLSCEGMLPGSSLCSRFTSGEALRRQLGSYCADDYGRCPWARLLNYKYAD